MKNKGSNHGGPTTQGISAPLPLHAGGPPGKVGTGKYLRFVQLDRVLLRLRETSRHGAGRSGLYDTSRRLRDLAPALGRSDRRSFAGIHRSVHDRKICLVSTGELSQNQIAQYRSKALPATLSPLAFGRPQISGQSLWSRAVVSRAVLPGAPGQAQAARGQFHRGRDLRAVAGGRLDGRALELVRGWLHNADLLGIAVIARLQYGPAYRLPDGHAVGLDQLYQEIRGSLGNSPDPRILLQRRFGQGFSGQSRGLRRPPRPPIEARSGDHGPGVPMAPEREALLAGLQAGPLPPIQDVAGVHVDPRIPVVRLSRYSQMLRLGNGGDQSVSGPIGCWPFDHENYRRPLRQPGHHRGRGQHFATTQGAGRGFTITIILTDLGRERLDPQKNGEFTLSKFLGAHGRFYIFWF